MTDKVLLDPHGRRLQNIFSPEDLERLRSFAEVVWEKDDPMPPEEVEAWKKRDPIVRFQKYMTDKGLLSDDKIEALEAEIKSEIQVAVDRAEEIMKTAGDPLNMFEHAYAEMPPYLVEQSEQLAQELAQTQQEASHG